MKADTLIRTEGMNTLIKNLGLIEAERFVMLIQKDTFDYTKWQENLFEDMTIEEIFNNAANLRNDSEKMRT
ncbi:MAG: hypothetical protein FWG99_06475 [Treponema sp.]|nr:hypothetical protein [Treponema sp.]